MESASEKEFKRNYQSHLKHLKLKGMQPKTIDAYSRALRRIGARFKYRIGDLSEKQLTDYFSELLQSHSWSAVKLDLYGLKFYYTYVLRKSWAAVDLVKPPKSRRLPDVLTVEGVQNLIHHTPCAPSPTMTDTCRALPVLSPCCTPTLVPSTSTRTCMS